MPEFQIGAIDTDFSTDEGEGGLTFAFSRRLPPPK